MWLYVDTLIQTQPNKQAHVGALFSKCSWSNPGEKSFVKQQLRNCNFVGKLTHLSEQWFAEAHDTSQTDTRLSADVNMLSWYCCVIENYMYYATVLMSCESHLWQVQFRFTHCVQIEIMFILWHEIKLRSDIICS